MHRLADSSQYHQLDPAEHHVCSPSLFVHDLRYDSSYRSISICVCRFILQLRSVHLTPADLTGRSGVVSSVAFHVSRAVGNLGAPLRGFDDPDEFDNGDDAGCRGEDRKGGEEGEKEMIVFSTDPLAEGLGIKVIKELDIANVAVDQ